MQRQKRKLSELVGHAKIVNRTSLLPLLGPSLVQFKQLACRSIDLATMSEATAYSCLPRKRCPFARQYPTLANLT